MDFKAYVRQQLPPLVIDREPEIVDELAQHLSDLYAEGRRMGLDHDVAMARAIQALPQHSSEFARLLETTTRALPGLIVDRWRANDDGLPLERGATRGAIVADLRRDVRYAVRMLARTPGFTLIVVLTLALGIGANAVIFSAVDAVLLSDAPVEDPDTVVSIYTGSSNGRDPFSSSSYPDFLDVRGSGVLNDVATFTSIQVALDRGGANEALPGELVSGNYFDMLGVRMTRGRTFLPEEDRQGARVRVVVISHAMWQTRLGGSEQIIGSTLTLNGQAYTVIGITPRGFAGPVLGRVPELWAPMALQPELRPPSAGVRRALGGSELLGVRDTRWINMVGRLAKPEDIEGARAGVETLALNLERQYPASNRGRRFTIVPLGEGPGVRESATPLLKLLMAAVVIVLLIACANVAGLLMVRAVARRREVAVRLAVGAGRSRLVRQLLTESVLLALLGAGGGLVIAWWGTPLLYTIGLPETVAVNVNPRVWLFAASLAIGSGLLFGIAPAAQAFRTNSSLALREQSTSIAGGANATRIRSAFVVAQVALSLMLLIGAGLFLRTLKNATSVNLGYDVEQVLLGDINLDVRGYSDQAGQAAYTQILEKVQAIPGVTAAGAARVTVLSGAARTISVSVDGLPVTRDNSNALNVRANVITERYLDAIGTRIIRGRSFLPSDRAGAPLVTIVSESLATRLFPNTDPIGKQVMAGDTPMQVIGVVPDTVYRSTTENNPPPFLYGALAQMYESGVTLHIKVAGQPEDYIAAVRRAVSAVDPQLVLIRPRALSDEFDRSLADQRLMATLVALFGGLALTLAVLGLYGVMAHLVSQRTTEIGIRMALGAVPGSIGRLMMTDGLKLLVFGAVLGLTGAFAAARYVQNQLFGVEPTDPATFAGVCLLLVVVGLLACVVPARRAMRVNPSTALRSTY